MAKYYEENSDAVNRCDRCNKPLSDPNASYGWWCAKLLGLDFYVEDDKLDYDDLSVYNEDDNDLVYLYDSLPKNSYPTKTDTAKIQRYILLWTT